MTAWRSVDRLRRNGVVLTLDADDLVVDGPDAFLTDEELERAKAQRDEIVRVLMEDDGYLAPMPRCAVWLVKLRCLMWPEGMEGATRDLFLHGDGRWYPHLPVVLDEDELPDYDQPPLFDL